MIARELNAKIQFKFNDTKIIIIVIIGIIRFKHFYNCKVVSLIIKNCKSDNSGNYYARIENESGAIKTNTAQLTINRMLK